jgi:hypothetical protein
MQSADSTLCFYSFMLLSALEENFSSSSRAWAKMARCSQIARPHDCRRHTLDLATVGVGPFYVMLAGVVPSYTVPADAVLELAGAMPTAAATLAGAASTCVMLKLPLASAVLATAAALELELTPPPLSPGITLWVSKVWLVSNYDRGRRLLNNGGAKRGGGQWPLQA